MAKAKARKTAKPKAKSKPKAKPKAKSTGPIERRPVSSTCLRGVGRKDGTLELEFRRSGAVYQYSGVSASRAKALKGASSIGRYFNKHIRNDYPYKRLRMGFRKGRSNKGRR